MSFSLYAVTKLLLLAALNLPFTKSGIRNASLQTEIIYVPTTLLEQTFSDPRYQSKIMTFSGHF